MHFAFLSTFRVARGMLLFTRIIITGFECDTFVMLLTSCINFHKKILNIKVFILILKVAG